MIVIGIDCGTQSTKVVAVDFETGEVLATGGRERTAAEYGALLATAGFELVEVRSIGALPSVLVGVAR
jgi:ribulose kinase